MAGNLSAPASSQPSLPPRRKKKDIRLNIIQCYAPTNDAEEEKKDDFYQQPQTVLYRRGVKDITILMGDFNAKI